MYLQNYFAQCYNSTLLGERAHMFVVCLVLNSINSKYSRSINCLMHLIVFVTDSFIQSVHDKLCYGINFIMLYPIYLL